MQTRTSAKGLQMIDAWKAATRHSRLLLTLAGAVLLLAVAAQPSPAAPRSFYGVAPQEDPTAADFDRMAQGKVGTLRIAIFWFQADPVAPAGGYDFASTDSMVASAAQAGVNILPVLYGTPEWVATGLNNRNCGSDCARFAPTTRAARAAWRDFVGAAAARYGKGGTFWSENPSIPKRPIKAWSIWNEQNSRSFFAPKTKPKLYAKLLDSAAKAINAQDRSADVVLGGMPQLAGSRKATAGSKYLGKLYDVKGAKKDFDGVATHPYGARIGKVAQQTDLISKVIKKARDRKADLWVTEVGAGSAKGGNPLNRGKKGQAKLLKQVFRYFEKQRRKRNVRAVIWYSLRDKKPGLCDWCATSGLLSADGGEKPAWRAFTKLTGGN